MTSPQDTLSTFVSQLGLESKVLGRVVLIHPWAMGVGRFPEMIFHLVVSGTCCYGIGQSPRKLTRLQPGDFVIFPKGSPHVLAGDDSTKVIPAESFCYASVNEHGDRIQKGKGKKVEFICGSFGLSGTNAAVLQDALPDVVALTGRADKRNKWIRSTLELLSYEVEHRADGSAHVIRQLLDTLFMQVLRHCSTEKNSSERGLFAALQDPPLMKALTLMTTSYQRPWSIESLARSCGISRTVLAVRFQALFGQGVVAFLRNRRISAAQVLLDESSCSVKEIAHQTGFGSSEVFIRNFERIVGISPERYRTRHR